ncbi:MAG: hypothetical protein ACOX43_07155 [Bacilli bacterium]|jgi:hypothetical protein
MELFKKLNYKGQKEVFILNWPEEFIPRKLEISKLVEVRETVANHDTIDFVLVFVKSGEEISQYSELILPKIKDDGIVWFAYPKKSSKKYKVAISRDIGWETLGDYNFEPVRQISIDEDWSALRFRKVEFIKSFTRGEENAISAKGKARATDNE